MVAVQMAQDHTINGVEIDIAHLQRDRRRRPTIQQDRRAVRLDQKAGVEASPRPECIAGANDSEPHGHAFALGRAATSACQRLILAMPSGSVSFAGFMKSTEIIAVISATL